MRGLLRDNAAWLLVALASLIVFPYFARLGNPNENVRVWMTRAIVAHGTFSIDPVEREWGETSDRAIVGGQRYSSKAPGTSLLGVPVMFVHTHVARLFGGGDPSPRAATLVLRLFTVALPLAFFFRVFGRAVQRVTGSVWARDLLVVALGLGTMLYTYALGFVGHAQSAALAFGGYLCLARLGDESPSARRLALGGALTGLAVVFEYQTLFAALALALFAVVEQRRRALYFLAGALGPAVLLGAYHTALFGKPWSFPYGYLDDPGYQMFHTEGFFGLGRPRAQVLWEVFLSLDYGLLVYSPFLALGIVGALEAAVRDRRKDGALVVLVAVSMTLFIAGMSNWRGGWCAAGPRYIAGAVPFVAWGVALSWPRLWGRFTAAAALLVGAVLASVAACVLASAVFPHYPLQFDNPLVQVSWRLVREGLAPYGLGRSLGLPGATAHLPVALLAAGASLLVVWSARRRLIVGAAGLAVAGVLLALVATGGRRHTSEKERTFQFVREVYEPRGSHGPL